MLDDAHEIREKQRDEASNVTVCSKTRFKVWRGAKETRVYVQGRYSHRGSAARHADGLFFRAADDGSIVCDPCGRGEVGRAAIEAVAHDMGFDKMTFSELVASLDATAQ